MSKRNTCGIAAVCVLTGLTAPLGAAHADTAKDIQVVGHALNHHQGQFVDFARVRICTTCFRDISHARLTTLSHTPDRAGEMGGA